MGERERVIYLFILLGSGVAGISKELWSVLTERVLQKHDRVLWILSITPINELVTLQIRTFEHLFAHNPLSPPFISKRQVTHWFWFVITIHTIHLYLLLKAKSTSCQAKQKQAINLFGCICRCNFISNTLLAVGYNNNNNKLIASPPMKTITGCNLMTKDFNESRVVICA